MAGMFEGCTHFNQPLESWNVSNVRFMGQMFAGCTHFNQPLRFWDVYNDCYSLDPAKDHHSSSPFLCRYEYHKNTGVPEDLSAAPRSARGALAFS
jgi:surface protein